MIYDNFGFGPSNPCENRSCTQCYPKVESTCAAPNCNCKNAETNGDDWGSVTVSFDPGEPTREATVAEASRLAHSAACIDDILNNIRAGLDENDDGTFSLNLFRVDVDTLTGVLDFALGAMMDGKMPVYFLPETAIFDRVPNDN